MTFEAASFTLVALLALSSVLALFFRRNKIVLFLSAAFGFLSAIYFVRNFVLPDGVFPSAFDARQCMSQARKDNLVFHLRTATGTKEVRDFRPGVEVLAHYGYPALKFGPSENFQVFYNPKSSHFDILLTLIRGDATPNNVANKAAVYLQETLCLRKQDICELYYEIKAPRATNVSFPEISGQSFRFSFCDQEKKGQS